MLRKKFKVDSWPELSVFNVRRGIGQLVEMFNVQKNFGHREYLSVFWDLADHKKSKFRLPSLYPCANLFCLA